MTYYSKSVIHIYFNLPSIYCSKYDDVSIMDIDKEEELLMRRLAKVQMEKARRDEGRRNVFELERSCKHKTYYKDDRSDGGSGTVV